MLELRPITPADVEEARSVMDRCFRELWGLTYADVVARYDPLEDMADVERYYRRPNGTFLVLVDDGHANGGHGGNGRANRPAQADAPAIVGTGGVARLDAETAELKRLWLLPEYRGRGLGRLLAEKLVDLARCHGYRRVCLQIATPDLQAPAVGLYTSLGFTPRPPYHDGPGLFMEKRIAPIPPMAAGMRTQPIHREAGEPA